MHGFKSIRAANELNKLIQGKTDVGETSIMSRVMSATGIVPKEYTFDVEKLKKGREFEVSKRKRAIKRNLNFLEKKFPDRAVRVVQKYEKKVKKI